MELLQSTPNVHQATVSEYFKLADASPTKLEFKAGEIVDMAGASWEHIQITMNIGGELRSRLKNKPCQPAGPDSRTRVASDRYCYPDILVVCGEPEFDPLDKLTITNPAVIFEVLSPSTESGDRGEKLFRYIAIPTLQAYYLVATDKPRVESFLRNATGTFEVGAFHEGLEVMLPIPALGIELPLGEIYDRVKLLPATT